MISEGICGAAGAAAGAGEDVAAAEEAMTRAAEVAAPDEGAIVAAPLAGAPKDSGADDPKIGAALAPDAAAEDCGVLRPLNEEPAEEQHSRHAVGCQATLITCLYNQSHIPLTTTEVFKPSFDYHRSGDDSCKG